MSRSADVRYTFTPSSSATSFEVVSFSLDESLSADGLPSDDGAPLPYRLSVELSSFDDNVDFSALLDAPAHFAIWRDGQVVRHVHGIVTAWDQGDSGTRRTRYSAVLEPALARLTLRSNCRIFQQLSVPDIIGVLLKEHGLLGVEWNLSGPHLPREFACQWNESDWAFVQRISADEGIVLSIEHEANQHQLIFTDTTQSLPKGGALIYEPQAGGTADQPSLRKFRYSQRMAPTSTRGREYTFWNAKYNLEHQAAPYASEAKLGRVTSDVEVSSEYASSAPSTAGASGGNYERYRYPADYKRDEVGKPFTRTRLNAERREAAQAFGEGDAAFLVPGTSYTLEGHPREAWNCDWLVARMHHEGTQHPSQGEDATEGATTYSNTVVFVARAFEWKAPLWPKPRMDGPLIATVVGPPNEEIFVDSFGRVRLQFPWDREGKSDEHSSCWVRVSQGWAGTMYGMQALPRIGHEVIVSFLGGDIDQPVVTGRTHHPGNLPPYELPRYKTRSTWKTQTHKGKGFNELRFDDEAQQEEIYLHAQKDHNVEVLNNETTRIGNDRNEKVANDETIAIGHDRTENVTRDEQVTVGNDRKHTIGQDDNLTIARNQTRHVGKDLVEDVGNHRIDKIAADHTSSVGGHVEHTVQGHHHLTANEAMVYRSKRVDYFADTVAFNTPGGVLLLDAKGLSYQGRRILGIAGDIDLRDGSGGQAFTLDGAPHLSVPADRGDLNFSH
ncbi:type VI secretion system Vgr family protein [Dyella terrae]|uniref:type VI secretion system Vgr family protein n=1 Tax=Dyella terrae TaxID=522259 RepID=UPI001EFD9DAA|nr:type VI secretion system tip protein TssI/VgrG [Dyella terrae]ULU24703.1 Actin cross-linking toxin VgrG1 [Dyella terrae]